MSRTRRPKLLVLAGVNGAGKSSVAGARLRASGLDYFNPDEVTRQLRDMSLSANDANALAWREGRDRLRQAIAGLSNFAIETTLGGHTLPRLIARACASHDVTVWFVGLDSPERHVARVTARVAAGGHAISEKKIRARWNTARTNLIALLPHLHEAWVYDNSAERGAAAAKPTALLHWKRGRIIGPSRGRLRHTPDWAKPIVETALQLENPRRTQLRAEPMTS